MQDASPKSENRFTELHLSETLKLCCQSAICNLGGLRTVCNAFGGLRDPEETLLPATVQLYSYYEGTILLDIRGKHKEYLDTCDAR
eukprot:COSAG01_NODE_5253_length_4382_cov_285.432407_2_plen_86_part_00